ncbi:MAG: hypothetical protein JNM80_15430 [Phycisphaerae bacterium]|nr:hypothetical protein [Phycisphaerae bacterium]
MATNRDRRRTVIIVLLLLLLAVALLLVRCSCERVPPPASPTAAKPTPSSESTSAPPPVPAPAQPDEVLSPATLTTPASVAAGATFAVDWTGPDNRGDFVTVVPTDARAQDHGSYQDTHQGRTLRLTAPTDPGTYEVRYVTGRSRTILARASIEVMPVNASLDAVAEVVLGSTFAVAWTGPNNTGDYVTIVPTGAPDAVYGSYVDATRPSPQTLTAPPDAGEAELRYVVGQGKKVLARRPIRVLAPSVSLSAPSEAIAGATIRVAWIGPNNAGDYVTVVPAATPDGQYGNYTVTSSGSPLNLVTPIISGEAELRYMTGLGNKVLARRSIRIVAAEVTLAAAAEGAAGSAVSVTWTGPNNPGDYITVVPKAAPDGQYGNYTVTTAGSPLSVGLPKEAGECEIRYVAGQGNKVLARRPIRVTP